jgi:hypothetical protein
MTSAPEQTRPDHGFTVDGLTTLITEAISAGDFDAVVAALHVMVSLDPHRAGALYETILLGCTMTLPIQPEEPPMPTDSTADAKRHQALTDGLTNGEPITAQHAVELAAAVVQLAGDDRVAATDERVLLAQAVLARADKAEPTVLDAFARDIMERCLIAQRTNDGNPLGAWSSREQLAVALVLANHTFLTQANFTAADAAQCVADGMVMPPTDMQSWVKAIRAAIAEEAQR